VAVDDSGSDVVGEGNDCMYDATVKRGGLGYTLRLLQNKHTTWTNRFLVRGLNWKSATCFIRDSASCCRRFGRCRVNVDS